MNYLLSLILLNPLEALVIILGCNIISGIKFDLKKDIKYIYLLSSINFIIQVLLNLLNYKNDLQSIYRMYKILSSINSSNILYDNYDFDNSYL